MMNMMYNTGWVYGLSLFYGLHIASVVVFAFGAALLLFWAFKHLSEQNVWKWGWILLVIGTIACLLTFPAWPSFGIMGAWQNAPQGGENSSQQQEEADGK